MERLSEEGKELGGRRNPHPHGMVSCIRIAFSYSHLSLLLLNSPCNSSCRFRKSSRADESGSSKAGAGASSTRGRDGRKN